LIWITWRISPTILANLVELTLEKQKLPENYQFFGYKKKKSVKLKDRLLLSENPLTLGEYIWGDNHMIKIGIIHTVNFLKSPLGYT